MGIDFDDNYKPKYISIRGKGDTIKELKSEAKKAKEVYLASDPDREGEAIAWHVAHALNLDKNAKNRVTFNEVTKDAVKKVLNILAPLIWIRLMRNKPVEFWTEL